MAEEERKRRKKKKKKSSHRSRSGRSDVEDVEGGEPLPVDRGEAEFANAAAMNAVAAESNDPEPLEPLAVEDVDDEEGGEARPALTLVQDEDAVPAPIAEPDLNGGEAVPEFTADGLAVATAVDASAEDEYIYSAIEYDPDSKPPLHKNRRFRVYTCLAFMVVVAVISIVVVYVTKSAKAADVTEEEILWNGNPTAPPTPSPISDRERAGIIEQIEAGVLERGATFNATSMGRDDPRYRALDWILHDDDLQLESDAVNLYQRYVLALLAFALDSTAWFACGEHRKFGNVTEPFVVSACEVQNTATGVMEEHKVWLSSTDECEWYGVICSSDGVVRGVELIGNDLIGEIPPEISQLRFLQYLAFNGNCLYGTIPPEFGKMPNLLSLELHGNGLEGEVPKELYDASKLQLLNVAMQFQFSSVCQRTNGTVVNTLFKRGNPVYGYNPGLEGHVVGPEVNKWGSMKGLHLFDNSFSGFIADEIGDLKYLVFLRAQNNVLTSWLPDTLGRLKKVREIYLGKNGIEYDIPPAFGTMEDLEDLRLNENPMNGTLPENLYQLTKLKFLWLQDTLECDETGVDCSVESDVGFSGTISSAIGNLKKLSWLILQNNPLSGTLAPELGLCEELAVLRIHKTNIEGSVPSEVCMLRDKKLNNEADQGIFYADCRPNNKTEEPFLRCDCCSDCCDHTTKVCIADD